MPIRAAKSPRWTASERRTWDRCSWRDEWDEPFNSSRATNAPSGGARQMRANQHSSLILQKSRQDKFSVNGSWWRWPQHSKIRQVRRDHSTLERPSWTAPAARSDDGPFARATRVHANEDFPALKSGVALRFPPQSILAITRKFTSLCMLAWFFRVQILRC
jgi:hypothetical protein